MDLILREIERSDNESLRAKKDIMAEFVRNRFYDLSDDADIMAEFEEFTKEREKAEIEEFSYGHEIDFDTVHEIMTDYIFNGSISDEVIRQYLAKYHLGLLKITKLTGDIKSFISQTYLKYKAEGD